MAESVCIFQKALHFVKGVGEITVLEGSETKGIKETLNIKSQSQIIKYVQNLNYAKISHILSQYVQALNKKIVSKHERNTGNL